MWFSKPKDLQIKISEKMRLTIRRLRPVGSKGGKIDDRSYSTHSCMEAHKQDPITGQLVKNNSYI
jgi:hypothetical protein